MSFSPCPSPPPPMPSPVLVPTPLPSPPPFTNKPSRRRRLTIQSHPTPPIPPSLLGSPLLKRTLNHAMSLDALHRAARTPRLPDDAPKAENRRPSRTIKSPLSRCRSPPPSPATHSPPPPVPPIPAFVLTTNHSFIRPSSIPNRAPALDLYLDHPRGGPANMCCDSQAGGTLTCMQFFAVHNPTGRCQA